MNILVTGAKGMVGTTLVNNLKNIKENKNKTRPTIQSAEIYEYDIDSTMEHLDKYCTKAGFVFNHYAYFFYSGYVAGTLLLCTCYLQGDIGGNCGVAGTVQAAACNAYDA